MSYIGFTPNFGYLDGQTLTFNGSTTQVTLDKSVSTTDAIGVFIDNVHQEPEVAYNLDAGGGSITFTGTPADGAVCYIRFHGQRFDVPIANNITDLDGDTHVKVEASSDNDTVIVTAGGVAAITATSSGVTIPNLTVTGTTTSINSTNLNIGDNQITLNSDVTGTPSENAGLIVNRGSSSDVSFIWNETSDYWIANQPIVSATRISSIVSGNTPSLDGDNIGLFQNSNSSQNAIVSIISNSSNYSQLSFGDENDEDAGYLRYSNATDLFSLNKGITFGQSITANGVLQVSMAHTSTYTKPAQFLVNDLNEGDRAQFTFGRDLSAKNLVEFGYRHKASNSLENVLSIGFYGSGSTARTVQRPDGRIAFGTNDVDANFIELVNVNGNIWTSGNIVFEGSSADTYETTLTVTNPTLSDKTITLPDATGTVVLNQGGILNLQNTGDQSEIRLYCETTNQHYSSIKAASHAALQSVGNVTLTLPAATGTLLSTASNLNDLANVNAGSPNTGQVLKWSGDQWTAQDDATASSSSSSSSQAYSAINAQTSDLYVAVLTDANKLITLSNNESSYFKIPTNSSVAFPVGTKLDFIQIGEGQVNVLASEGVTIHSTPTAKLRAQYSGGSCVKAATNTWYLVGDLAAT